MNESNETSGADANTSTTESNRAPVVVAQTETAAPVRPPRFFVELVNADLRGKISLGDRQTLTEDPRRWLGILGSVLQSVRGQMEERAGVVAQELARPERSEFWADTRREHGEWVRKARYFEALVKTRIAEVRQLVPDDDLVALLHDAYGIDVETEEGRTAWRVWLTRVQRALVARGEATSATSGR